MVAVQEAEKRVVTVINGVGYAVCSRLGYW